jgi:hypothetical protein
MMQTKDDSFTDGDQKILSQFLHAWHEVFGSDQITASQALQYTEGIYDCPLKDAIHKLYPKKNQITAKGLGRLLNYRAEIVVDGLKLQRYKAKSSNDAAFWRVTTVNKQQLSQTQKSNAAPFWKPAPSLEKQEEQKADVYMMSVNILEKLQPMLLNIIYDELLKEVNDAA